jgi:hypothetical protein
MHLLALGAQCALLLQLVLDGSDRLSKVRLDRLRVGGACAAAQAHTDDFGRAARGTDLDFVAVQCEWRG